MPFTCLPKSVSLRGGMRAFPFKNDREMHEDDIKLKLSSMNCRLS